jgi:hypothetical protein
LYAPARSVESIHSGLQHCGCSDLIQSIAERVPIEHSNCSKLVA